MSWIAASWLATLGREAALVADGGADAAVGEDLLQRVEGLGAVAHGLRGRRARRSAGS
jgi:hypothetical protein